MTSRACATLAGRLLGEVVVVVDAGAVCVCVVTGVPVEAPADAVEVELLPLVDTDVAGATTGLDTRTAVETGCMILAELATAAGCAVASWARAAARASIRARRASCRPISRSSAFNRRIKTFACLLPG